MREVREVVSTMTLEEKAGLCSGRDFWRTKAIERLGVPSVMLTDGPHGLRKQASSGEELELGDAIPATCFPSGVGLASTWNRTLIREVGAAIGAEARREGVAVLLGPAVNIKRSPLCGRNFEYLSEDPFLTGAIAAEHIAGVQSQGVGTSIKHFAANNQETRRMTVDARVDERALREIYLAGFETAVKEAHPWTVMCAYNRLNGVFCAENRWLLTDVLRDEWGHRGIVVTDWGANNDRVAGLLAGQDLEMPGNGGLNDAKLVAAVRDGRLSERVLDEAVERILRVVEWSTREPTSASEREPHDHDLHHALARRAAAESFVLLKNVRSLLPLTGRRSVAFIGAFAERPRYQGGGSSHIRPTRLDRALAEARAVAGSEVRIEYEPGYSPGADSVDEATLAAAREAAGRSDAAVVFVGLTEAYESEGFDRTHLRLPESHTALVEAVLEVQPDTVVVLSNGAPVEMPWADRSAAILETYLGGQAWGGALADVLFGVQNPSGKLAETFPVRLEDNPSYLNFPGDEAVRYREDLFVGYRYYDACDRAPLFPFGFGLSYTSFEYGTLRLSSESVFDDEELTVAIDVTNTGGRFGREIVQLYIAPPESAVSRPKQELKGFDKMALEPGETRTAEFTLCARSFAHWDTELGEWYVEPGVYEIRMSSSSRDIRARAAVRLAPRRMRTRGYHENTRLGELLEHPIVGEQARGLSSAFLASMGRLETGSPEALMMEALVSELPLRNVVAMSAGRLLSDEELATMLRAASSARTDE